MASKSSNSYLQNNYLSLERQLRSRKKIQVKLFMKCSDCEKVYISESGRELGTMIKEHQGNINKLEANSQICKHLEESGHANFDWNNVKVLGRSNKKVFNTNS